MSFPKKDNGDVGAINCADPNDYSSSVQVEITTDVDITKINKNDLLKIYAVGQGALTEKNAFGGDVTVGSVLEDYVIDLTIGFKNY